MGGRWLWSQDLKQPEHAPFIPFLAALLTTWEIAEPQFFHLGNGILLGLPPLQGVLHTLVGHQ